MERVPGQPGSYPKPGLALNPNVLWIVWGATFLILELAALRRGSSLRPLTYWLRFLIAEAGWAVAMGAGWLLFHLFIEPLWRRRK